MGIRKGFVHTLEATLISIIVLTFVLGVIPSLEKKQALQSAKDQLYGGLESLDRRGILRAELYESSQADLSAIKLNLSSIVSHPVNFTVGVTNRNRTEGTISISIANGTQYQGNMSYSVNNETVESAFLELVFSTGDDADFYLNGDLIGIRDVTTNTTLLDLSDRQINGTNVIDIQMPSQQNVTRRLEITTTEKLESLPQLEEINVVSYFVAGVNSTYDPKTVQVYLWE